MTPANLTRPRPQAEKGQQAGEIPFGWSYNPSTWPQRLPIIGLAMIGFFIASYLALYQLRIIPTVWEPFFGRGSVIILNSSVSRVLPIPDAALGAIGYLLDAVTGAIGGRARWRTMPWIVIIFGLAVGPLGAVSIMLVILQPVLFDAFCTLCLVSAAISLIMIGPALDEMLASLQYLKQAYDADRSLWHTFWGTAEPYAPATQAEPSPPLADSDHRPVWPLVVCCLLGVWLMMAPAALGYGGPASTSDYIVGPLVASFAVVAIWDVLRPVRWIMLPFALWLLVAPWLLGYAAEPKFNNLAVALVLLVCTLFRGKLTDRLDGGWSMLLEDRPASAPSRPRASD